MILETPVGSLTIGMMHGALVCLFGSFAVDFEPSKKLASQLLAYLDGDFVGKFDAPISPSSPFAKQCWAACRAIPYGTTITYAQLAHVAGSPKASRAAGQAMKRNPTVILTPCHRVVASSGKLHGFAGSTNPSSKELARKIFLLDLELRTIRT